MFKATNQRSKKAKRNLKATRDLVDVELMSDHDSLTNLSKLARSSGHMLICHRCRNVKSIIAGVLIIHNRDEAWALCGPCLRKVPLEGQLAS
jgi:hypothetical protein